ncbi:MAG: hypothetical protein NC191_06760 [Muribaculaceae bacterium]|nr:hypothetical protein [Muribaculaceae bacterium]
MKKKIIFFVGITIILAGCIAAIILNNRKLDTDKHIRNFTENAKIIDANMDHNQALDVSEYAKKQGFEIPSILINFDTHSDIYVNRKISTKKGAQIEDWINEFVAKNNAVDTVYWVMPDEEARDIKLRADFGEFKQDELIWGSPLYGNSLKPNMIDFLLKPLTVKSYTQNMKIDSGTGIMNEYVEDFKLNHLLFDKNKKYRDIKVITCTAKTLPDFKDKKVFLSIDADYVSNSGFDTVNEFQIPRKTTKEMNRALHALMKTIDKKNIRPEIISLTISPEYLPKMHHNKIIDFYEKILIIRGLPDALLTYTRFNEHEEGEDGKSYKRKEKNKDFEDENK